MRTKYSTGARPRGFAGARPLAALTIFLLALVPLPALADGGAGGQPSGGAGGIDSTTGFGGVGGNATASGGGGGGGGAGTSGGSGGTGLGTGGNGGDGGAAGAILFGTASFDSGTQSGTIGGTGAPGTAGGGGGGGGAGGYGIIVPNGDLTIGAVATVLGGNGGSGGTSTGSNGGGGSGGVGIFVAVGSLVNNGTIIGGNGGNGGNGGVGGAGVVVGPDTSVTNSGIITGGLGGGAARANAITFTGGANTLTLQAGSAITGNIAVTGSLNFSQATAATLSNVISGTGSISKSGAGVLTLSGVNTYTGSTTITAGTLAVSTDANLGAAGGGVTFSGGTLQATDTFTSSARQTTISSATGTFSIDPGKTLTWTGDIGGSGNLVKQGTGTLVLSGTNSYANTLISAGTLSVAADANLGAASGTVQISSGTTLQATDSFATSRNALIRGASTFDVASGKTLTWNGLVIQSGIPASLIKTGDGTLVLGGSTSYSAGTTVSAGTLQGTTTSLQGNILDNATLAFVQVGGGTYGGVISGSGNVVIDNGGGATVNFTGNNTYAGTTTINDSWVRIGLGGTTGSLGTGNVISNGGTLFFSRSDDFTVANQISGTASLFKLGDGTLTLTGANTYIGATGISGGTIAISADNNLGNTSGTLNFFNGTLKFLSSFNLDSGRTIVADGSGTIDTNGFDTTISQAISGAGSLTKAGAGTLILGGANSFSGGTTVSAGTLQGTTTSLQGNITNNATLAFVQAGSGAYSGVISGSGNVTVDVDAGRTLRFAGNNTYTGTTTVNGWLQIGQDGTSGSLGTGNVIVDGILFFNRSDAITVANQISGPAALIQLGDGTLTLTAANTYVGATEFDRGTVAVSADNNLGNGGVLRFDGGTLKFLSSFNLASGRAILMNGGGGTIDTNGFDTTISQAISESGGLTKAGAGKLTLSAVNTYTGATTVNAGELSLNGSVAGNVLVNAGGTLSGIGTVGGSLTVGGNLAPGNSIGTLTVVGTYTQSAGSTYTAEVNAPGQTDLIRAGAASLQGGVVTVQPQAGTYRRTTTYTIVSTTGALTGTYTGATSSQARLVPTLSYGASAVTLSLLNLDATYNNPNFTPNQNTIATVLNQANAGATGDFANVLNALSNLDPASIARVLDAISGQVYSGFGTLNLQSVLTFMDNFQFQAGGGLTFGNVAAAPGRTYTALAEACDVACDTGSAARWGAWGGGVGAFGTIAGDSNSHGLTYNLGGFAAGLDRKFGNNFMAGIATGFNAASLYTQGMPGYGTSNTLQFALYGEYAEGPVYLDGLAGYAHADNRMSRPITIAGMPYRVAQGYATANLFFGQVEAGYKVDVEPRFGGFVMPFARLQGSTSTQNGFTESGADSLNLTVAQQTTNSLRTVLGAQLGAAIDAGWYGKLNLLFKAGWSHEYADLTRPVTASFAGAPALGFTTQGASAPRDGVVLGFGLNTAINQATNLYFRYDGDLAGGNTNHALSAGVRFVW